MLPYRITSMLRTGPACELGLRGIVALRMGGDLWVEDGQMGAWNLPVLPFPPSNCLHRSHLVCTRYILYSTRYILYKSRLQLGS